MHFFYYWMDKPIVFDVVILSIIFSTIAVVRWMVLRDDRSTARSNTSQHRNVSEL